MTITVLPASTSRCQNFYQFIDISHVETDGRLIKNVNRLRQLTAAFADVVLYLRELSDELDALGFAAGGVSEKAGPRSGNRDRRPASVSAGEE